MRQARYPLSIMILLGFLLPMPASAASVEEALLRMGEAISELDYKGTYIQIQDGEVETLEVTHHGGDNGSRERLITLNGSVRELVREHDSVKCIHRRERGAEVDLRQSAVRFHAHLGRNLTDMDGTHYSLVDMGKDRVAGRTTRVVGIRPNDQFRYGFRFWVDRENGMPLRSDMVSPDGEVIQQVMFTRIRFGPVDEADLQPVLQEDEEGFAIRHARYAKPRGKQDPVAEDWPLEELPAGFYLSRVRSQPSEEGQGLYHFVVSDGLAQVSVFLEPVGDSRKAFEGDSRMGTVHASGRQLEQHQLTVVGEVPKATVQAIALAFEALANSLSKSGELD